MALNRAAAAYWHEILLNTPRAMDYLESRGFSDPEAVARKYRIGFAPGREDAAVPFCRSSRSRGIGTIKPEELDRALLAAGLASWHEKTDSIRDFMYGRLVFPIVDRGLLPDLSTAKGHIVAFGGRHVPLATTPQAEDGPPKWLNTRETILFSKRRIPYGLSWAHPAMLALREVIVLEGYLDVIQVREAGFLHVCAVLGTALTPDHVDRFPGRTRKKNMRVILCTDDDSAGHKAAYRGSRVVLDIQEPMEVRIARPFNGLDPDDLIRQHGPPVFQRVIDTATTPVVTRIEDLKGDTSESYPTLRTLIEFLSTIAPLLSRTDADRIEDRDAIESWILHNFGASIPALTLQQLLDDAAKTG